MTPSVIDTLIGILNRAFDLPVHQERELPRGNEEWEKILSLSTKQRVLPLVVSMFDKLPPDRTATWTTAIEGRLMAEKLAEDQRRRLALVPRLAGLFRDRGLDVMFIKGATLSLRYPSVELRYFGDLDFYLFGHAREGAETLAENGIASREYYHHHIQASWKGVLLENHYDFVDLENHKSNRVLDEALKGLAERERRPFALPGEKMDNAYRMSPTMEAVFLMRHMSAHFASAETELRQLYDWVLLVRQDGGQINWWEVCRLYEASGMMRFAGIVSWIIREKLSVDLELPIPPDETPVRERVWAALCDPDDANKYKRGSFRYNLREAQLLLRNRWKYKLVYPGESFPALVFNMLRIKLKLGL